MVHDKGFERADIANKKGTCNSPEAPIAGRNLVDRALSVTANYRLALKYHDEYCVNGNIPSGKTVDDMLLYVRQKMFVFLKGAKNKKTNNSQRRKQDFNLKEEDTPEDYMFSGYFAFALLGPQGLSSVTLNCLTAGDSKAAVKQSRAQLRAADAERKTAERKADMGGGPNDHRGSTLRDKEACANLAATVSRDAKKECRDLLLATNGSESNCLRLLEQLDRMLQNAQAAGHKAAARSLMERQGNCLRRLDEINERKRELESRSDRLMSESKRQITSYYEHVGLPSDVPEIVRVDDDSSTMPSSTTTATTPSAISLSRASIGEDRREKQRPVMFAQQPSLPPLPVFVQQQPQPPPVFAQQPLPQQQQQLLALSQASSQGSSPERDINGGVQLAQNTQPTQEEEPVEEEGPHQSALDAFEQFRAGLDPATRRLLEQSSLTGSNAHDYYAGEEEEDDNY